MQAFDDAFDDDPGLKIITYNIWFEGGFNKPEETSTLQNNKEPANESLVARGKRLMAIHTYTQAMSFRIRMEQIVHLLLNEQADVICLQEVTHWSHEILCNSELSNIYDFSTNSRGKYGVLMLALKTHSPNFQTIEMPTNMGRDLLCVSIVDNSVLICGSHFESLSSANIRQQQLQVAKNTMNNHQNSILVGDFNFCSYRNYDRKSTPLENENLTAILPNYQDLWCVLNDQEESDGSHTPRPEQKGYTFDSELNHNINQQERMRYDRILCSLKDLKCTNIHMIGTDEITHVRDDGSELKLHPSDHFGLVATFVPVVV